MKLAATGVISLLLGLVLGVDGLLYCAAIWIPLGLVARWIGRDLEGRKQEAKARGEELDIGGWEFARNTLVLLAIGLPSLVIGIFEIGIPEDDRAWRWLPLAVGALISGVATLGSLLYVTGSGLASVANRSGADARPATVRIRSMRETGVYINERPRIEFELTVTPEGLPAYEVTKKATVPYTALGSLRQGAGFEALVAGDQPDAIEINWDAPLDAPSEGPEARLERLERLLADGAITRQEYAEQRRRVIEGI